MSGKGAPLAGKGAFVTGGSRGIGRAVVERFSRDGAKVVFTFLKDEAAAKEVEQKTGARGLRADQANDGAMRRAFELAEDILPGLDIIVMNAATGGPMPLSKITDSDFDRVFAVNTRSVLHALQWADRHMRDGGRVIAISTLNTKLPSPGLALYQGSKAAAEQFIKVAARELGPRGITCNTVSPGATATEMLKSTNTEETLAQVPAMTALGRVGTPEDIAAVAAFLAGPDAGWITGSNISATGGFVL